MNHVYRLIWNRALGALVPAAEIVRAKGGVTRRVGAAGLRHTPLGAALAMALSLVPTVALAQRPLERMEAFEFRTRSHVDTTVHASPGMTRPSLPPAVVAQSRRPLPTGGQVVAGQVDIGAGDHSLTIKQSSQRAIIDWRSFDIGAGNTVTFRQPGRDSVALNRVLGTDPSAIYGHLNANGQVFLVNPYGVYFAPGAQVNVGGLVASTLGMSDSDFLAGRYRFGGTSSAGVRNDGAINAAQGGYVAFLGRTVDNTGAIATPGGATTLGAGGHVTLTLAGQELVSFAVDEAALQAQVSNGGAITADGGRVVLSAQAKDALMQTVVNNNGRIRAQTVRDHRGVIDLLGGDTGTVQVAGTLDVSAPQGGDGGAIETSGAHLKVSDSAVITEQAANGADGEWLIDPFDFTIAASGGDISGAAVSAALDKGNLTIQSTKGSASGDGDIFVNDTVSWSSHRLTLQADRNIIVNVAMEGSEKAGLQLRYGYGDKHGVIDGVEAQYILNAPINLSSEGSFKTKLGSKGSTRSYTIITSLGKEGSKTKKDLQGINGSMSRRYVLGADIDATETADWNDGKGFAPIGGGTRYFTGILDGLGHTITGLTIDRSTTNRVGLIGKMNTKGVIRNIALIDADITGKGSVGGLVGYNRGTIANAYVTGAVHGTADEVGGLVGLTDSHSTIGNSYANVDVDGQENVGGLVGRNRGDLFNAYALGSVDGTNNTGGLVGSNDGDIASVYVVGHVSGASHVGGLVGMNDKGAIVDHGYWDKTTTGQNVGYGSSSGQFTGSGLTTAQLAGALPSGFDADVWGNADNRTTPYLLTGVGFGLASPVLFGSDTGTTPTPTNVILTLDQLRNIERSGLDADYLLVADIDASTTAHWNNGVGFDPIGDNQAAFTGSFSGLDHVITDLTIHRPDASRVGLFGVIGSSGSVRDFGLIDSSVVGASNVGALAGVNDGSIQNVYVTGRVDGGTGSESNANIGGLVGLNNQLINNAFAMADVGGRSAVGGLVGRNDGGSITQAYASGSVSGGDNGKRVGGLVGANSGNVSHSYATGNVGGASGVGGLVGQNDGKYSIYGVYAVGHVSGNSSVGGLVGSNKGNAGSTTYGYWDTATASRGVGSGSGSGVTGRSTAQLAAALPAGFSSAIWNNAGKQSTPYLLAAGNSGLTSPVLLGSDTSTTPTVYNLVLTVDQLQNIERIGLDLNYALGADIDASDTVHWNDGAGFDPIGDSAVSGGTGVGMVGLQNFTGIFDGLGHKITGLVINRPMTNYVGLFSIVGEGGIVRNVGLVEGSVHGFSHVGALAGLTRFESIISDVYATSDVTGINPNPKYFSEMVGGLVGENWGSIVRSYATGTVYGGDNAGGLAGRSRGTIEDSYATGDVTGANATGGLVGMLIGSGATLKNVYATGNVTSVGWAYTGGLIGLVASWDGSITNAHATGRVEGAAYVGGLAGSLEGDSGGSISNVYATGDVSGTDHDVGGLVGFNYFTNITNAYATGNVSGKDNVGGFVGYNKGSMHTNVYAAGHVSGTGATGGLAGVNDNAVFMYGYWDGDATGQAYASSDLHSTYGRLTTAQMHQQSSYVGFNFDTVWTISGGNSMPQLNAFSTSSKSIVGSGDQGDHGSESGLPWSAMAVGAGSGADQPLELDDLQDGVVDTVTYRANGN